MEKASWVVVDAAPHRSDFGGLVNHRHLDGVGAEQAPAGVGFLDRRVSRRTGGGVQRAYQILDRLIIAVVLDLHEPDDAGVEGEDCRNNFGALPLELDGAVCAPGIVTCVGDHARPVDGREVVQNIEAGDPDVPADVGGSGRARIRA